MDWKEETRKIWNEWLRPLYDHADCSKDCNHRYQYEQDKKSFIKEIQQLLDQRDEQIIGKLEAIKHTGSCYEQKCKMTYNQAIDQAISTIKESK